MHTSVYTYKCLLTTLFQPKETHPLRCTIKYTERQNKKQHFKRHISLRLNYVHNFTYLRRKKLLNIERKNKFRFVTQFFFSSNDFFIEIILGMQNA